MQTWNLKSRVLEKRFCFQFHYMGNVRNLEIILFFEHMTYNISVEGLSTTTLRYLPLYV